MKMKNWRYKGMSPTKQFQLFEAQIKIKCQCSPSGKTISTDTDCCTHWKIVTEKGSVRMSCGVQQQKANNSVYCQSRPELHHAIWVLDGLEGGATKPLSKPIGKLTLTMPFTPHILPHGHMHPSVTASSHDNNPKAFPCHTSLLCSHWLQGMNIWFCQPIR